MPPLVQVRDDRVHSPVSVPVDDVAAVTCGEEVGVKSGIIRPFSFTARPGSDSVREFRLAPGLRLVLHVEQSI
tara:strand:+ start:214 stop:432 length:219 start_codon:yes stop_codon:yes gene_type:complete